jgi:hypothetical protein
MNSSAEPEPTGATPGKTRTWWHPLLVNLLRWQLGSHYRLEAEVLVGQKPLQIDILLLQLEKEQGELSAHARAMLSGLIERLGRLTLIELKAERCPACWRSTYISRLRPPLPGAKRSLPRSG